MRACLVVLLYVDPSYLHLGALTGRCLVRYSMGSGLKHIDTALLARALRLTSQVLLSFLSVAT